MLSRTLEPEVMDTPEEARDYDAMDHAEVNRAFVSDFLTLASAASLEPQPHILDVGTGTALIPIELCTRDAAWRLTAVDLSREMLKLAERNVAAAGFASRVQVVYADAKRLPFADGGFAAVISNSIIHHIPEPVQVFAEMRRLLRDGGLLFVRDLLRPGDERELERLVETYAGSEKEHAQAMFRASLHAALTLDEVQEMLSAVGLPGGWARQTSDRHWTLAGTLGGSGRGRNVVSGLEIQLRAFRPEDLPILKQITTEAFDGVSIDQGIERLFGPVNGHDWRWRKARHLDDDAARDPAGIFIAEIDGRIVGYITTWHDRDAGLGYIPNLAIAAEHRGRGIGRRLLEYALDHFRRLGLTHARIETLEQNAIGNHLYPSLGFREVARQVHFCAELRDSVDDEQPAARLATSEHPASQTWNRHSGRDAGEGA